MPHKCWHATAHYCKTYTSGQLSMQALGLPTVLSSMQIQVNSTVRQGHVEPSQALFGWRPTPPRPTNEEVAELEVPVQDGGAAGVQVQHAARDAPHDGQQLERLQLVGGGVVDQHVQRAPALRRARGSNIRHTLLFNPIMHSARRAPVAPGGFPELSKATSLWVGWGTQPGGEGIHQKQADQGDAMWPGGPVCCRRCRSLVRYAV
jgi:hypothetical protein